MADETSMALEELLRKAQVSDDVGFLRARVRALAQALIEVEVSQHVGAKRYERSSERTGERNGSSCDMVRQPVAPCSRVILRG